MTTMRQRTLHTLSALSLAAATAMLAACGGGDSTPAAPGTTPAATTVQITGLAATGAAIGNATVTATNVRGEKATAVTNATGAFTINIGDGAPYVLSISDAAGKVWYSFAQAAGVANINPLTTLALLQANGNKPLADLAAGWSSRQLTATQVLEAAKVVNANLASVMNGKGIDPAAANPFVVSFTPNGTGFDAVLDAMRVNISCTASSCTQTINGPAGQSLVSWNANIATSSITLNWTAGGTGGTVTVGVGTCKAPQAGTYSLVVQTSVTGVGSVPIPEVCIDGLPAKPATQSEFCGASTVTQQLPPGVSVLSCSYDGSTGTIAARITSPITLDYSVKYTFVPH